jgi:hypothetical protein
MLRTLFVVTFAMMVVGVVFAEGELEERGVPVINVPSVYVQNTLSPDSSGSTYGRVPSFILGDGLPGQSSVSSNLFNFQSPNQIVFTTKEITGSVDVNSNSSASTLSVFAPLMLLAVFLLA